MRKTSGILWPALLLALMLAFSGTAFSALAENEPPCGDWYAELNGFPMQLTLGEDGAYTLSFTGLPDEPTAGTWKENDGFVILDEDETSPLSWDGDNLSRAPLGLYFTREPVQGYIPGELMAETDLALYEGPWRAAYVLLSGAALPAGLMGEDTMLFIEDSTVALTGGIFSDIIVEFAFENGALTLNAEDASITLCIQEDSLLRMTVAGSDEAYTLILERFIVDALSPDTDTDTQTTIPMIFTLPTDGQTKGMRP